MKKILETDMFLPVKDLLVKNGYKVCSEIEHCDIAAMKDDELVIIELKTNLTMDLLLQAVKRQRITENVYIGVPKLRIMNSKKWKDYLLLIKRLGLGLIVVSVDTFTCEVVVEPSLFHIMKSLNQGKRKKNKLIKEFKERNFDNNVGGSKGKKIMTSYKDKSLYIACCLELLGPLSPKKLRLYGADSKKTTSILSKNFNGWFFRVKNGVYDLTDEGKKAIETYKEVSNIHKKTINSMNNCIIMEIN